MSDFSVNVVVGGVAGAISKTALAPFERVKILQQTGGGSNTTALTHTVRQIFENHGVRGFWTGNFINCIRIFPNRGASFASQEFGKKYIFGTSLTGATLAGGFAGVCATVSSYPIDLLRTRLAGVHKKEPISEILISTWRNEGIKGFYRGQATTLAQVVPYSALIFGSYEFCRAFELNTVFSGFLSGVFSGTIVFPLDTVRRVLQASGSKQMKKYDGPASVIKDLYRQGGFPRFFRGAGVNCMRIGGQQAVVFGAYENIKAAVKPLVQKRHTQAKSFI